MDVMRQRGKSQPQSKLDAIADSLTAEVISKLRAPNSFAPEDRDPLSALSALFTSGSLRGISGTPYSGALDRLIRIYREVDPTSTVRASLPTDLLCISDFKRGLAMVRAIILENEWTAPWAMDRTIAVAMTGGQCATPQSERQLIQDMLRDLWEKRLAKGEAAVYLAAHAARQGWR